MSLSRLSFGFDSVQVPVQHGIDACMDAIGMPVLPGQHAAAAGIAVTNSTRMAATVVANLLVVDMAGGYTLDELPRQYRYFDDAANVCRRTRRCDAGHTSNFRSLTPSSAVIVRAMEHQAAAGWRRDPRVLLSVSPNHTAARGVHDYVADLLFNEIQPETLAALDGDPAFVAAYNFPNRA